MIHLARRFLDHDGRPMRGPGSSLNITPLFNPLIMGAGRASFAAAPAAGALAWWKSTTLTQAAGLCTGWTDAGSLARNLTIGGSPAPTYLANASFGLAGAQLTAANSDNFFNVTGQYSDWLPQVGFDVFWIARFDVQPTSPAGIIGGSGNDNPTITSGGANLGKGYANDGAAKSTGTVAANTGTFYIWDLHYDGTNLGLRCNGVESSTVALGTYVGAGQVFRIGVNNGNFVSMTAIEGLTYGAMTGAARTQTLSYLAGLTGGVLTP